MGGAGPRGRLDTGTFVVSIDTEMAWGANHKGPSFVYSCADERRCIDRVAALMEKYEVPGTWAIVGHLFLDRCEPVDGTKHPEIVRADYPSRSGDWFDADPCSDAARAGTWYAPDVVERILSCSTAQEIASHSFSHLPVGGPACSPEVFDSELRECRRLAAERNIALRSFVFPRNVVGHLPVLRANGFRSFRGQPSGPATAGDDGGGLVGPLKRLGQRAVLSPAAVVYPEFDDGLWNLPSTFLFSGESRRRTHTLWIQQALRRLRLAARHGGLFHLWFHPHNIAASPEVALVGLERLLREVRRLRDAERLSTLTMNGLVDRLEGARAGSSLDA